MIRIFFITIFLLMMGFNSGYTQVDWEITEVIKHTNCNRTVYRVVTSSESETTWGFRESYYKPEEYVFLMKYFNVSDYKELEGIKFESTEKNSDYALSLLILHAKFAGHYIPPTDEELRIFIVKNFAQMRCPNFSDYDTGTMTRFAFREYKLSYQEGWLDSLKERVYRESGGTVILTQLQTNCVPAEYIIKTTQQFFLLTKATENGLAKMIVRFASFAEPFDCF